MVDGVIAKLEGLGRRLRGRDAIHPEETEPEFVLVAQGMHGMAFLHVLDDDAETFEEPDAYADWVRLWVRATEKSDQVSDIDSIIDGGQGGVYAWLLEESVAEFCDLFPETVQG